MSDIRLDPEGSGNASEEVDTLLDDLATGQHEPEVSFQDDLVDLHAELFDEGAAPSAPPLASDPEGSSAEPSAARERGEDLGEAARAKIDDLGASAQAKADEGLDAAASGLGQAADKLREQGEAHEGTAGTAATRAADALDSASTYLRDKDSDQLLTDLEALVRRKPVETLLAAAGIGFVLSKLLR